MRKMFTQYICTLTVIAFLFGTMFSTAEAGKRRVLLEDHTGARCGWCVVGNENLETLLSEYGDSFIPVAVHTTGTYRDAMQWSGSAALAGAMGVTGYPAGTLNRKVVNAGGQNSIAHHPAYWPTTVAANIDEEAIVDVQIEWTLDKVSGALTGTVNAEMLEDYNGQLAFNFYVMEDHMTGSGPDWDHANYVSGRSGYESYEHYNMPNPATNYDHVNVLREMLGGTYGVNGEFPSSVKKGDKFSHEFTYNLNSLNLPVQNPDNIWVVGLIQEVSGNKEILNSIMDGKEMPQPKLGMDFNIESSEEYGTVEPNKSLVKTIKIENNNDVELTADISIDNANSLTPNGWSFQLDKSKVTIPANSSADVMLTVNASASPGHAIIGIKSVSEEGDDFDSKTTTSSAYALSTNVKKAVYTIGGNLTPLAQSMGSLASLSDAAFIPATEGANAAYPATMFEVGIFPEDFNSRGTLVTSNGADALSLINDYVDNGKPVLITSVLDMFFVAQNTTNVTPTQASKALFNTKLGITGFSSANPILIGNGQSNIISMTFAGTDDEIASGFTGTMNQYNSSSHPYYSHWVDNIKILDETTVTPFLKYTGSQFGGAAFAGEAEKVCGVKIETEKGKIVYMGFSFDLLMNMTERNTLLGNVITWLTTQTSEEALIQTETTSLDFGEVVIEKTATQTVEFTNKGKSDLVIQSAELTNNSENHFGVEVEGGKFPITLKYNETIVFNVSFMPTAVSDYSSDLTITSNATNNDEISIEIQGIGSEGQATLSIESDKVEFEEQTINESATKVMTFTNSGDNILKIDNIELSGAGSSAFEVKTSAGVFPINIEKGKSIDFDVVFTPTEEASYLAFFALISNASNNDQILITLSGSGKPSSVYVENSDLIDVTIGPNPIKGIGNINYVINSSAPQFVKMNLFNSTGENLSEIVNGNFTSGNYSKELDTESYPSGSYYVVIEIDGVLLMKSFVISK